jgi:hypothetical protein
MQRSNVCEFDLYVRGEEGLESEEYPIVTSLSDNCLETIWARRGEEGGDASGDLSFAIKRENDHTSQMNKNTHL